MCCNGSTLFYAGHFVGFINLVLLEPVGQVVCGVTSIQRDPQSAQDISLALLQVFFYPVQLGGQRGSFRGLWNASYSNCEGQRQRLDNTRLDQTSLGRGHLLTG